MTPPRQESIDGRPAVSVVVPFAGSSAEAADALARLAGLTHTPSDELLLADNSGTAPAPPPGVRVVRADGERSPAHARNVGAAHATREWILFLDADTDSRPGLLDAFFAEPIAADVGALAGGISGMPGGSVAARYGAARGFLDAGVHLAHPYLPRAASANLLVRAAAFTAVGGFLEGVRAAEDTDLTWRLQRAGWRLEGRPQAQVVHRYRSTVSGLRHQWRDYAAGRAWLGRRYDGFEPVPPFTRAARKFLREGRVAVRRHAPGAPVARGPSPAAPAGPRPSPGDRLAFVALDALLSFEELGGLALSNRPIRPPHAGPVAVVLVADRFPAPGDPLADYALSLSDARIEATARPETLDPTTVRRLRIDYREDDGAATRALAGLRLATAHPRRALRDLTHRHDGEPPLRALAPAARRIARDPGARVRPLGPSASTTARRLAALAGRPLE
jgi:GT2 family glycosyltransferase